MRRLSLMILLTSISMLLLAACTPRDMALTPGEALARFGAALEAGDSNALRSITSLAFQETALFETLSQGETYAHFTGNLLASSETGEALFLSLPAGETFLAATQVTGSGSDLIMFIQKQGKGFLMDGAMLPHEASDYLLHLARSADEPGVSRLSVQALALLQLMQPDALTDTDVQLRLAWQHLASFPEDDAEVQLALPYFSHEENQVNLYISVRNNWVYIRHVTPGDITIVDVEGTRHVHSFNSYRNLKHFPIDDLRPGDKGGGYLVFSGVTQPVRSVIYSGVFGGNAELVLPPYTQDTELYPYFLKLFDDYEVTPADIVALESFFYRKYVTP